MIRYALVSVGSGLLFGLLDGLLNANPLARSLYSAYQPIARTSINVMAGLTIDLVYGFVMAAMFMHLYRCLPGQSGLIKGVSFAVLAGFFRVGMGVASQWVMFTIPVTTLFYMLAAGMFEMLILGLFYGMTLNVRR